MLNKVILIGHLGRAPEDRVGNRPSCFSVATSERWTDKTTGQRRELTEWHNVAIFEPALIEIAEKYLRKGSKVYIEGRMGTRSYEGRDGVKRSVTEVVVQGPRGKLVLLDRQEGDDVYGAQPDREYA